jgi:hypothetical protein
MHTVAGTTDFTSFLLLFLWLLAFMLLLAILLLTGVLLLLTFLLLLASILFCLLTYSNFAIFPAVAGDTTATAIFAVVGAVTGSPHSCWGPTGFDHPLLYVLVHVVASFLMLL